MTKIDKLEDEDSVIRDGQTLRVPMFMMDSLSRVISDDTPSTAGHKPGSLAMADADRANREKLYEARDKRLTDAWKNPPALEPSQAKTAITSVKSGDIYERRDARLRDAWRNA